MYNTFGDDNMNSLKINNISVKTEDKEILKDFSLEVNPGEIHVIMGPNGTGKSTLLNTIMGDSSYVITSGEIYYNDKLLNNLDTSDRANLGIFLGMQKPISLEGVSNADFLRTMVSSKEKENFNLMKFVKKLNEYQEKLKINKDMVSRSVNTGFSGGEIKKNEILEMYLLNPSLVMLDEIDSGLDVDSLKIVADNILDYYKESGCALLIITHYQKLLDYIKPTHVHIMKNGKIIKSGDSSLINDIEQLGYENLDTETNEI